MWMHVKFLKTLNTQRISLILTSVQVEVRKRRALTWFFLKIKRCTLIMKIILLKIPVCEYIVHIFLFKNTILRKLEAFNSTLFPAEHLIVIITEINIGKTSSSRKITDCKSVSIHFFLLFLGVDNVITNAFPPTTMYVVKCIRSMVK